MTLQLVCVCVCVLLNAHSHSNVFFLLQEMIQSNLY